ncbi:hypothetical protein ACHAPF_007526 [Botrytis cinerea]|uniref:Uncharacterized protein n=1 Tax=Botryotinia fuckeliana (strain T4) TaxID=999810 RepID=G2Y1E7_BOTF4|nr:predicted protein [Botrytis cinerea T4]
MANNDSVKKEGKKPAVQKSLKKKSTAQKPVSAFSSSSSEGEEEDNPTTSRKAQNLPGDMRFRPGSSAFNSSCSGGSSNGGTQARSNTPPSSGQIKGSPDNSPRTKEKHRNAALDSLHGKKPKK